MWCTEVGVCEELQVHTVHRGRGYVKNYRSIQCTEFDIERFVNARSKTNYFEHNQFTKKKNYSEKKWQRTLKQAAQ
jgi:hypothetical protein